MTTPNVAAVIPYGITLAPENYQGIYLIPKAAPSYLYGASGMLVPSGVFSILVASQLQAALNTRITFSDGSPARTEGIIPAGGVGISRNCRAKTSDSSNSQQSARTWTTLRVAARPCRLFRWPTRHNQAVVA